MFFCALTFQQTAEQRLFSTLIGPYCAYLAKQATLYSFTVGFILIGFKNNEMRGSETVA